MGDFDSGDCDTLGVVVALGECDGEVWDVVNGAHLGFAGGGPFPSDGIPEAFQDVESSAGYMYKAFPGLCLEFHLLDGCGNVGKERDDPQSGVINECFTVSVGVDAGSGGVEAGGLDTTREDAQ